MVYLSLAWDVARTALDWGVFKSKIISPKPSITPDDIQKKLTVK